MRPIDADALEKIINEGIKEPMYQHEEEDWYDGMINAENLIKEQLTIELPQWIPCSEETGEGYPKEDGLYYVTEQNYGFYLDADYKQRLAHISHFRNGDFTNRFYLENYSNITAWMLLPEPYKKGEE